MLEILFCCVLSMIGAMFAGAAWTIIEMELRADIDTSEDPNEVDTVRFGPIPYVAPLHFTRRW